MWYLAVFLSALAVDLIPVVAPPAWLLMVFFLVKFQLDPWTVLLVGVIGSTIGRYLFSLYVPNIADRLIRRHKREDMEFLGEKLGRGLWRSWMFVLVYTLTPLSTSALFTAAALGKVKALHTVPAFFVGKLISDAIMIFTGSYAVHSLGGNLLSVKGIVVMLLGAAMVAGFLFLDWRSLLQQRKLRFDFRIWK